MGYFSNGSEGMDFEDRYCSRCVHEDACPVLDAHMLYAYEECNNKSNAKRILDMLIERKGLDNECRMFVEQKS